VTDVATSETDVPLELETELERQRSALTGYCYRMLGSSFEADDAVQETMLRAWRSIGGFEGRAPLRAWLFRIATNVCFDMLNGRRRRALPMDLGPSAGGDHTVGGPAAEVPWILPMPDRGVVDGADDPAESAALHDDIRLAFVAALQHLQPRPRAVLVLRDVVGWSANEVAAMFHTTATSVHSTLQRARHRLAHARRASGSAASAGDPDPELLARYVDAFLRHDIDALVALLHADVTVSMPPNLEWMQGRAAMARWWRGGGAECLGSRLVPTRANGTAAFGLYRPAAPGRYDPFGLQVMESSSGLISAIHTFIEPRLFPLFQLPARLVECTPTTPPGDSLRGGAAEAVPPTSIWRDAGSERPARAVDEARAVTSTRRPSRSDPEGGRPWPTTNCQGLVHPRREHS
jgi:RNA polymerase sigma-70 factor, ECF subfamily